MRTNSPTIDRNHPSVRQYALCRKADAWEVTFKGQKATFKHELGALYVAYLLGQPPQEPIHGVALAFKAREMFGLSDAVSTPTPGRLPSPAGSFETIPSPDLRPPSPHLVPKAGEGARQPSTLNSLPRQSQATAGQPSTAFVLSSPMPVVEREETRARTELGAAQKDTARELGARLSSLKGIVWVGVGLFVFGLASLVWPPLKVVIGSVTTSAALMLGGVALMVLPSLVVGNELLILGGVGVAVGGWFLAHRHGHLRGMVSVKRET